MAEKTSFKMEGAGDACDSLSIKEKQYVLSLDIGTSNIRCHLYNRKAEVCGR